MNNGKSLTTCQKRSFLPLNVLKCVVGWGSAPDPAGGTYSDPPDLLAAEEEGKGGEGMYTN
jgi:hypothetical protein